MSKATDLRRWGGDLLIALYSSDTVYGNFYDMGHVEVVEVSSPEITEVEEVGRGLDDFGEQIDNAITETTQDFIVNTKGITKENLVAALSGTASDDNQSASTATDENITSDLDMWHKLGTDKRDVSITTVNSAASAGGTVYTEDDDWIVKADHGFIKFLSTGDIVDATATYVTYDYAAITAGYEVGANLNQAQRYRLELLVTDERNSGHGRLVIPKCQFNLAGALAFINSDGNQTLELAGTMLKMLSQDLWTIHQWP